jgi:16S rRNA (cytosine967-C5)-methyltransferase
MKFDNQLRYAVNIINSYDGSVPLAAWLKDYYRTNKQMGSTDRRTVSQMVYGYYRTGFNQYNGVEEKILAGLKAAGYLPNVLEYFVSKDYSVPETALSAIFPWKEHLSAGIDADAFAASFLVQPDLFMRIRPGQRQTVEKKLSAAGVEFSFCGDACVRTANATKIDAILEMNKEVVIQDKSSQSTGDLLEGVFADDEDIDVWDCCAASGGKSIMIADLFKKSHLTVSDIRESIVANLKKRFAAAGITKYETLIIDLAKSDAALPGKSFDLIVADVPCSGSGTWARTPEQLFFFREEKIAYYSNLQKIIASRVASSLKKNGVLLYITCSVFKEENEEVVDHLLDKCALQLLTKQIFAGCNDRADTLFAAVLKG